MPKSRVTLVRGATSRKKVFEILKKLTRERDAAGVTKLVWAVARVAQHHRYELTLLGSIPIAPQSTGAIVVPRTFVYMMKHALLVVSTAYRTPRFDVDTATRFGSAMPSCRALLLAMDSSIAIRSMKINDARTIAAKEATNGSLCVVAITVALQRH